ncbi:MAG: POTRA domain-containing protein, partial [Burkholderiaceae bacterium]
MRIRVIKSLAPLFVAVAAIGSASTVGAQSLRLPGDSDTSRIRPPALPLPATPSFDLRIESPERSAIPKAVDEIDFEVKAIVVEGVTAYSPDDVNALFSDLKGRRITLSALRKATEALENRYR